MLTPELARLADRAQELLRSDIETSSRRTYNSLQKGYVDFCKRQTLDPYEATTVALYIAHRVEAGDPKTTLQSRLSAIRRLAQDAQRPDPCAHEVVRTIARNAAKALGRKRNVRRTTPAVYERLPQLLTGISGDARMVLRDRALVLFGFALAKRATEIASIDCAHITRYADGWVVEIPETKTNKSGESEFVGVPRFEGDPHCPIAAVEAWLDAEGITSGPVFRTLSPVPGRGNRRMRQEDIARRLGAIAARAGLQGFWASHSLRRGLVTSAEQHGVARSRTRMLTGWKSDAMFAVYADHESKVAQSPLHEIFGRISPQQPRLIE